MMAADRAGGAMPTHYFMFSFQDFGTSRDAYREHVAQKAFTAGGGYTIATFEGMQNEASERSRVKLAVRKAQGNKVKILLHGHGDGTHDSIHSDNDGSSRTADQLTTLIRDVVASRATTVADAPNNVVVMLSCLYGKAQNSDLKQSNAWKLHRKLQTAGVYTELTARTQLLLQTGTGLAQSSYFKHLMGAAQRGVRKIPFAKVRCKYAVGHPHAAEIVLVDSAGATEIAHDSLVARRHIWTLATLDAMVTYASHPADNANHKKVRDAVAVYDLVQHLQPNSSHLPDFLRRILQYLCGNGVVPVPPGLPAAPSFVTNLLNPIEHQSWGFFGYHSEAPKTAQALNAMLARYP